MKLQYLICFFVFNSILLNVEAQVNMDAIYDSIITKGVNYTANAQFPEALKLFNKIIDQKPEDPVGYLLKANVYAMMLWHNVDDKGIVSDLENACNQTIEISEKALSNDKNDVTAIACLGGAYGNLGLSKVFSSGDFWDAFWNGRKGKKYLEKAIEIDNSFADAYIGVGMFHCYVSLFSTVLRFLSGLLGMEGNAEKGVEELNYAIKNGKYSSPMARYYLGDYYYRSEQYNLSKNQFTYLTEKHPLNGLFWLRLGNCEAKLKNNDKAIFAYGKAIEVTDTKFLYVVSIAYNRLGDELLKKGSYQEAIKNYDKAIIGITAMKESNPKSWHDRYIKLIHASLSQCYETIGDYNKATEQK